MSRMIFDPSHMASPDDNADGDISLSNLYPAIIQCFAVILLGYMAGRGRLVSSVQGAGIAAFVSKFCLPSLLFINMCELNFGSVNWMFLLGIFISKAGVFVLVALVTLVAKRPINLGYAGLFAIFATQSNDFALGYPIVQALYSKSNPGFLKYIYLIAPIQLAILNPIGFVMMEIHKHRTTQGEGERTTLTRASWNVVKGIVTNPIIFMTVIGIGGNFAFGGKVPDVLADILTVLGQAYAAGALFYLGLSMVGKIRAQLGLGLLLPFVLIAAKCLVLPLVTWQVIDWLEPAQNGTSTYSMFGFLYGTIPTAPSLVLYATHFDLAQNVVASGLVLGTFLSAPLMFVSAKMMTVVVSDDTDYRQLLHETGFNVSIISLVSGTWVLLIFIISGKWQRIPHRYTMALLFANMLGCIGMILYKTCGEEKIDGWHFYPIVIMLLVGTISTRCWTAVLSLVLCLLRVRSLCYVMRIQMWLYFGGFGIPIMITGFIFLLGSHNHTADIGPSFHFGTLQTVVTLIILTLSLVASISFIVYWQRAERHWSHAPNQFTHLHNEEQRRNSSLPHVVTDLDGGAEGNGDVTNEAPSPKTRKPAQNGKRLRAVSIEDLVSSTSIQEFDSTNDANDTNNALMESISERTCLLGSCSVEQRHSCMDDLRSYAANVTLNESSPHEEEPKTSQQIQQEEYQTNHHLILLLLLLMSISFGIFLCSWKLFHTDVSGIYAEVEFLDIVLNYGQGFFILAIFGFDTRLVFSPVMRRLRRLIFGAEVLHLPKVTELSSETTQACHQFMEYHKDHCAKEIVRDRKFRLKTFKEVFTGSSLCDWLLRAGLVSCREEGAAYGQHLLLGRVITHISGEFNFHDSSYFYKFIDKYELLPC